MKKIKIAQIGIGHDHADMAFKALLTNDDIFDVVGYAICEGEESRLETRSKYFTKDKLITLEEIFKTTDLDAVTIECDEEHLTKYSLMCAKRGLHIHMDKPGGISQTEYEKMLSVAKKNNIVFHTGYMYRYNPVIEETIMRIKNGNFGNVYSIEAHMDCEHKSEKRKWLSKFPGGMMFYLGCHLTDLILQIQGTPEEIIPMNMCTGIDDINAEDFAMAIFKYKNGISFAKASAAEPGGYMRRQLVICSDKRTLEIKPLEEALPGQGELLETSYTETESGLSWRRKNEIQTTEPFDRYKKMMRSFADYVMGTKENPYTYEYEALLHRVVLASCGVDIDYKGEIEL